MSNWSQMPVSTVETGEEYLRYDDMFSYTNYSDDIFKDPNYSSYSLDYTSEIITISVCTLGLVGNGVVIWFLGFCLKRNPITTYILNLAVADFGVLTGRISTLLLLNAFKNIHWNVFVFFKELFLVTYMAGLFLLMVIGIDRCVLVFFPIWHRCHRPPHLSTVVCTIIWVVSLLVCELPYILSMYLEFKYVEVCFILNALLCLPLLSTSTLALFIKAYFKSQQRKWGKLLVAILLSLLFFLIFAFPFNVPYILSYMYDYEYHALYVWGILCTTINSSIKPVIYYLIGRKKGSPTRESLKVVLQRVFKEENCGHPPVQMSTLMSP